PAASPALADHHATCGFACHLSNTTTASPPGSRPSSCQYQSGGTTEQLPGPLSWQGTDEDEQRQGIVCRLRTGHGTGPESTRSVASPSHTWPARGTGSCSGQGRQCHREPDLAIESPPGGV